ncbi:calcium/sodium antiporter [Microbacterium atlanticum]|uniref:calcium/sodium antiporter n=1 Tax=Microbacterium atlanticum TaxID=2782168 RepID=UPI00188925AB|nr:calcium/sodium antiporter [Microbacterium atlanticum]
MAAWLGVLVGLVALIIGAELVVRYGARLARRLGVPPIVVGLTIVSLGTSAPELAVGIDAVMRGVGSLAVGNIVGTNIVNLLLILGLSALLRPIAFGMQTLRLDLPAMAAASILLLILTLTGAASDTGSLSRVDGVALLMLAVIYTVALVRATRRESVSVQREFAEEYPSTRRGPLATLGQAGLLLVGIAVIVLGASWLVDGAVELAEALGVSDAIIALTIVAVGTSAPELATTIVSTIRGDRDIAIGNLIGSSTYNLTAILGASLLFADQPLPLDPDLVFVDLPIMTLVALVCIPVFLTGRRVTRVEGGFFVAAYVCYLAYLLIART